MKVTVEVEVTKEFCSDVLIIASEGGLNYWAERVRVTDDADDQLRESISFIREDDESYPAERFTVNHEDVVRGIQKLLNGEVHVNAAIREYIHRGVITNDAGNIDSDAADCIVQAAAFGDVVYG